MFRNKMHKLYLINDIDCYENNLAYIEKLALILHDLTFSKMVKIDTDSQRPFGRCQLNLYKCLMSTRGFAAVCRVLIVPFITVKAPFEGN